MRALRGRYFHPANANRLCKLFLKQKNRRQDEPASRLERLHAELRQNQTRVGKEQFGTDVHLFF